jgi:hypothetical protein
MKGSDATISENLIIKMTVKTDWVPSDICHDPSGFRHVIFSA